MFVIILTYIKPLSEIDAARPAHLEFLDKYYAKDILLASGRQTSNGGGVLLAKAGSRAEIERIIEEDPYHIKNLATYQIIEFTPTKTNENIGKLLHS
jgi:uncharacterized protein YciI